MHHVKPLDSPSAIPYCIRFRVDVSVSVAVRFRIGVIVSEGQSQGLV